MINLVKKITTAITVSVLLLNSAQAFQMACGNETTYMEIKFGQNGDQVKVVLMDGTQVSFLTKFTTLQFETRCGTQLNHSAGLYDNYPVWANGYIAMTKHGEFCGASQYSLITANIHLNLKEKIIDEKMVCKHQIQ